MFLLIFGCNIVEQIKSFKLNRVQTLLKNMRKTINVTETVNLANNLLENVNLTKAEKSGICYLLESILSETKNYKGYMYIGNDTETIEYIGVNHPKYFNRKYFK